MNDINLYLKYHKGTKAFYERMQKSRWVKCENDSFFCTDEKLAQNIVAFELESRINLEQNNLENNEGYVKNTYPSQAHIFLRRYIHNMLNLDEDNCSRTLGTLKYKKIYIQFQIEHENTICIILNS